MPEIGMTAGKGLFGAPDMTILSCAGNPAAGFCLAPLKGGRRFAALSHAGRKGEKTTIPDKGGGDHDRRIHHRRHPAQAHAQRQVVGHLPGRLVEELWRRPGRRGADSHSRPPHPAPPARRRPSPRRGLHGRRPAGGEGRHPRIHDPAHDQRGEGGLSRHRALAGWPAPPPAPSAHAQHPPPGAAQRGASL